jgi:hypothetical protein
MKNHLIEILKGIPFACVFAIMFFGGRFFFGPSDGQFRFDEAGANKLLFGLAVMSAWLLGRISKSI